MDVPKNDPKTPKIVWARAPEHEARYISVAVHEKTLVTFLDSRRLASLGQYAGLIYDYGILAHPIQISRGLLRPYRGMMVDDAVLVYIAKPSLTYTYRAEGRLTLGQLRSLPPPLNSVFIAFVSLAADVVDEVRSYLANQSIDGALLYWEWTMASESNPNIPEDSDSRYGSVVWPT
jgi:hypothetical protein